MLLTVTHDAAPSFQGSVTLLTGHDENDNPVRFAADSRMANDVLDGVTIEGEVTVEVEGWQLWGRA